VRSALGFNANDLLGRSAASLLSTDRPAPEIMPFSVRKPIEHASCWMLAMDGEERCLSLNAIPMFDDHGNWLGARGVCRDITAEVSQRTAFTRLTEREKLVDGVIEAMRNAPEPSSMLAMAVREMANAVKYSVTLLRRNAKGLWYAADGAPIPEKSLLAESLGRLIDERGSDNVFEHDADCGRYLCRAIKVGPVVNGALIFFRAHPVTAFPSTAATLVDALIGPLGIAIAQADHIERLQQLSSIDELTGLLNRRAFIDAANQRLAMGRRQKRQAVFLYLDLDHFKPINDRLGHQAGDKLLRQIGQLLHNSTRANDLAVRLGGDEFGLWLDAADIGGAITKGEVLLQAVPLLSPDMAVPGSKLGLSIGIAEISYGNDETIIDILSRADAALYNAKRAGRGRWYVAPPPEQKT
jgi:diguanylate cyclase (GGDEF)-like protein